MISIKINEDKQVIIKQNIGGTIELSIQDARELAFDIQRKLQKFEIDQIEKYAAAMKIDFCEFDVLRHKGNQKIYIIDVNKTPYGPPDPLNKEDKTIALKKLSEAFLTLLNAKV
jgi:hypothetical protein